MKFAKYQKHNK